LSLLQGRIILFVAIAGLLALMGGFVYYASLDNPDLEKAEVKLADVELIDVNTIENNAKLQTTFLVKNPSEKTFTVALITYELLANGESVGRGQYSTQDIAMPGRAAFYPGTEIPLKSIFRLTLSQENAEQYRLITQGESVEFMVKGIITVETAWSIVEKEFEATL